MSWSPDFSARHPVWQRYAARWEMAHDFWRGGLAVLQPDRPVTQIQWAEEEPSDASELRADAELRETRYQWVSSAARSYLFKHGREPLSAYEDRSRRQINLPLFQYAVNALAAGVLQQRPDRPGLTGPWEQIDSDVDLVGTDVDAFMRRALTLGLVFGRVHCVTDRPIVDATPASQYEQILYGGRVYAQLVTPLDLVDWACDRFGHMRWAVIRESAPSARAPGGGGTQGPEFQYRVWYPDRWELWIESAPTPGLPAAFALSEAGENPIGRVPICTLYCTRLAQAAAMEIESPLADTLDLNRHLLNKLSELDETERAQAFSLLVLPKADGASGGPVDVGKFSAIEVPMQFGSPMYLSPNPAHPDGAWNRIDGQLHAGRQLAGIGRGRAEYSKEERSASAILYESEDKRNQLAWWAKALQEFDGQLHADLAAWEGIAEAPRAAYRMSFEARGPLVDIEELERLSKVPVMIDAREAQAALAAPIVRRILFERGADPATIAAAVAAIEDAGAKEPPPPPAPFGGKRGVDDEDEGGEQAEDDAAA